MRAACTASNFGGQLINDWFAQEPFDAEGFDRACGIALCKQPEPDKSALLTRSINFAVPCSVSLPYRNRQ